MPDAPRAGGRKILIVDDEPKVRQALAAYFTAKGFEVRMVADGQEALALADVFAPDVVLLDLLMPGMSGVELLKLFKQRHPAPKVIMVSAADHAHVAAGALQLGADAYVCKPAHLPELERLVSGFWPS
jgi:two-component system response regulator RegX3